MVLIFLMSAMMLIPRLRSIFKAPVPHIHNIIGITLIPWGFSYLAFLPDIYLAFSGAIWRGHAYVVVSLLVIIMCISSTAWSFTAVFQQDVKQKVIQPLLLFLPISTMLWYALRPEDWLLKAFFAACILDTLGLACYVYILYRAFVEDVMANYSSVSSKLLGCIRLQWWATALAFTVFFVTLVVDNVIWNIIDILTNFFVLCLFIYTSEHLIPLPEKLSVEENPTGESGEEKPVLDLREALAKHCEERLLFCNPDLSLQNLAIAIGTNRTYLSKWFMTNETTFYNYINGLRIEHAGHLLLTTDAPVAQIQARSGFISKTTFRKYFIERYHCTPSEYRRQQKPLGQ